MTSGAIQNGVPTKVFLLLVVLVNWPATPKSANLTSPISLNKTFAALKTNNKDITGINFEIENKSDFLEAHLSEGKAYYCPGLTYL